MYGNDLQVFRVTVVVMQVCVCVCVWGVTEVVIQVY